MNITEIATSGTLQQLINYFDFNKSVNQEELYAALSKAVFREDMPIAQLLIENGANPNLNPNSSMTPLHLAVENMNLNLIKFLCNNGANVNIKNAGGWTPLHLGVDVDADSAWQRQETPSGEIVGLLLDIGVDPFATDSEGRLPIDIARDYQFERAIELLQKRSITITNAKSE